jgi:uncharacterized membrane protein YesL
MTLRSASPEDQSASFDWRDSLALAADLALLGIVVSVCALLVVPAGGALAAASVAADYAGTNRALPPLSIMGRAFRRGFWPGLVALAMFVVAAALLAIDLWALTSARVPGGFPLIVVTVLLMVGGLALALLTLVRVGMTGGVGWVPALAWSARLLVGRPQLGGALVATLIVPVLLALVVPVTAPLLAGLALFALHVVVRRLGS